MHGSVFLVGWLVGWLVGCLFGWLFVWLVGWLVCLFGRFACLLSWFGLVTLVWLVCVFSCLFWIAMLVFTGSQRAITHLVGSDILTPILMFQL